MKTDPSFVRASRVAAIEISEIVQISEAAAARRRAGQDVISLGTGEPDFDTPVHIREAAAAAMHAGQTRYTPTRGSPQLLQAVCEKFCRDNQLSFAETEVIISTGAKQIVYNALCATLEPGDEVIVAAPFWSTYADIIRILGATPVVVQTAMADGFRIQPEQLRAAISERSRWLLLNAPGNPAGAVYSAEQWRELGAVLHSNPHVWLMSDEIYEHLCYLPEGFVSAADAVPRLRERILLVNGVSKAYAMTGWRIGYGAGPAALIAAMTAVQGQITSGACSVSQAAAVAALTGPQHGLAERRQIFRKRRDTVVAALNDISLLQCPTPDGAFYVFPSCELAFGKQTPSGGFINSDADFCRYVLDSQNLAVVPGGAFGCPGHLRLSYAYAQDELEQGMDRLCAACEALC